jgi:hypothetical protein
MSDVFISYSKADRALALKLAAFLEAEGWTVWWDKSLAAADLYRDEIMKQLARARAVITIWSPNSIRSDWVRAEAGRAKAEGKLIPVKTSELTYGDIPLPFGEMHTENVLSTSLIRAAIIAQLAKPASSRSPFWQITSLFKYQALTWIGILGSVFSLFVAISAILTLANGVQKLVNHWHEWTQMFWGWIFGFINLNVPREVVPALSFLVFALLLIIGVNLSERIGQANIQPHDVMRSAKVWLVGASSYIISLLFLGWLVNDNIALAIIGAWAMVCPVCFLLFVAKERSWVFINSLLFICMGLCLILAPLSSQFNIYAIVQFRAPSCPSGGLPPLATVDEILKIIEQCQNQWDIADQNFWYGQVFYVTALVLFQICWMAVILFSPQQQLTRRLGFVVLGVLTLVGLSEISKLSLHRYLQPPTVSDDSTRSRTVTLNSVYVIDGCHYCPSRSLRCAQG